MKYITLAIYKEFLCNRETMRGENVILFDQMLRERKEIADIWSQCRQQKKEEMEEMYGNGDESMKKSKKK
jgi:hypothetical protein